jgi:hypothetical protein
VAVEELLAHAALYYLSDLDSGRMAARVFRPRQPVARVNRDTST